MKRIIKILKEKLLKQLNDAMKYNIQKKNFRLIERIATVNMLNKALDKNRISKNIESQI